MWLKKTNTSKFGFHPVKILEDGAINWELHCGCCCGTAEHFILTPKENQELFEIADAENVEPSTLENLLEEELLLKKKTGNKK